jgi:hypothetical protein
LVSPMEDKTFPKADRKSFSVGSYLDASFESLQSDESLVGIDKKLIEASYDVNIR